MLIWLLVLLEIPITEPIECDRYLLVIQMVNTVQWDFNCESLNFTNSVNSEVPEKIKVYTKLVN